MSSKITAYIIEDEANSRLLLRTLINKYLPHIKIVGESDNLEDAEEDLNSSAVDILFCDIKVKGQNAMDFVQNFDLGDTNVIFTTAYSNFAIQAFRLEAVDYLLKPITAELLVLAVNKAISNLNTAVSGKNQEETSWKKLIISESSGLTFLDLEDVLYIKADNTYSEIYLKDGSVHVSSKGLSYFTKILESRHFYRIHHSHLVNLMHVKHFDSKTLEVTLTDNQRLTVSSRKKIEFIRGLDSALMA